jgi:type III restriction enzyme
LHYFPNLKSSSYFIESKEFLGDLAITFIGAPKRLNEITHFDYLQALNGLLANIENEIKSNSTEFEGSDYISGYVHKVFKDKEIRVRKGDEREKGQLETEDKFKLNLSTEKWFAFNDNFGTIEEKAFVSLFSRRFESLNQKFEDIYLIRNEREIKIFDKLGRAFEPDFLLFCKQRNDQQLTFQVFIEPKGSYLIGYDSWKNDFLKQIQFEQKTIKIHTDNYLITAVPFYNYNSENEFGRELESVLSK